VILAELQRENLVEREADPVDRRQILVSLPDAGRTCLAAERQQREDWLSTALDQTLNEAEREVLAQAIAILRRVAES
jgi:DNA-binding MarR family transcriptional regulator